jgi:hypothetical protein
MLRCTNLFDLLPRLFPFLSPSRSSRLGGEKTLLPDCQVAQITHSDRGGNFFAVPKAQFRRDSLASSADAASSRRRVVNGSRNDDLWSGHR